MNPNEYIPQPRNLATSQPRTPAIKMTTQLKQLKDRIEALNQHHQIQILKIVTQNNVAYTENKNGSFVNLTNMDNAIVDKIAEYLNYVDEQESQLKEVENQKTELTKQFFK